MTNSEIATAIKTRVYADFVAAYPNVPIVFDNDPFDWNAPPVQFVQFEVEFEDGAQIGISPAPKTRKRGCAYVTVLTREGAGNLTALDITDWFADKLGYYQTIRLHLQAPQPQVARAPTGWRHDALRVGWYADPA
jgi:hypothetical protein